MVGSIVPDAAYCFGPLHVDVFAHQFIGIFGFALPAGMAMLAVFYAFRQKAVEWLPENQRQLFKPLSQKPIPSPMVLIVSVLIGAWTHILWDSFTHRHGWLVEHVPALRMPMMNVGHHDVLVCHFLWYLSSFAGVAWVSFAFEKWRQKPESETARPTSQSQLFRALLVGLLVLPIETLHHLVSGSLGFAAVGICSLVLVMAIALNFGNLLPRPQKEL